MELNIKTLFFQSLYTYFDKYVHLHIMDGNTNIAYPQ